MPMEEVVVCAGGSAIAVLQKSAGVPEPVPL